MNDLTLPDILDPLTIPDDEVNSDDLPQLSPKQLQIVQLSLRYPKIVDVARQLGITTNTVRNTLKKPEVVDFLRKHTAEIDTGLLGESMRVMADLLRNADPAIRFRAADAIWRAAGRYDKAEAKAAGSEDLVTAMLAAVQGNGTAQITVEARPNENINTFPLIDIKAEGS